MKVYRVVGGMFAAGPGASILLLAAVAAARAHNLEPFKAGEAAAVLVTPRNVQEFKAGELVGLEVPPKGQVERLEEVTKAKRGSPEEAMLAAVAAIDRASAAAAEAEQARVAAAEAEQARVAAAEADKQKPGA